MKLSQELLAYNRNIVIQETIGECEGEIKRFLIQVFLGDKVIESIATLEYPSNADIRYCRDFILYKYKVK